MDPTVGVANAPVTASYSLGDVPTPLAGHPRYEILGLIGKGGMGDVFKATHRMMERTVALKIIKRELVQKPEAVDRFHREVKAAAKLSHPNIVTAYDAEQAGDVHFLVMEYVDGSDLSQLINDQGALPIADACNCIRQAAIGLQHAHERGMVHRDIKPHNLMVVADGTVKILDFGLASLAPEAVADADTIEARGDLTAEGAIMGTPDFISPEQADDAREADIRSDIYSLGATLYFLLSGRAPFADGSVLHKLKSHAQVEPEPLESLRDDIPAELSAVISRMMAKDPNQRYQTPAEVAEALLAIADTSPDRFAVESRGALSPQVESKPANVSPRRRPVVTAALFGLILALIAAAVSYFQSGKTTLRFEINDPNVNVRFADESIGVDTSDSKTFRVEPATQQIFVVYQYGLKVETDSLTLRRGQKVVVAIRVVEGEIKTASNLRDVSLDRARTNNAALQYWQAFALIPQLDVSEKQLLSQVAKHERPLEDAKRFLTQSRSAMKLAARVKVETPCRWKLNEDGLEFELPHLNPAVMLAHLFVLQSRVDLEAGRQEHAVENLTHAMVLARNLNEGYLIQTMTGSEIEALVVDFANSIVPKLTQTAREQFLTDFQSLQPRTEFSTAIRNDRDAMLKTLGSMVNGDSEDRLANLRSIYDKGIAACRLPYDAALKELEDLDREIEQSSDPFVASMTTFAKIFEIHSASGRRVAEFQNKLTYATTGGRK